MKDLREEISQIDNEIIDLLGKRMAICKKIGAYKKENNLAIKDQAREDEIVGRLEARIGEDLSFLVKPIYNKIFKTSSYYQSLEGKLFGLVGKDLSHSLSPLIHQNFGYGYKIFDLGYEEFQKFMESKEFSGVNITIPYKVEVMDYLDYVDPLAKQIGSVNTVVNDNGRLMGYNTDYYGLEYMLKSKEIGLTGKKVLILASGGASLTAQALARNKKAKDIRVVSRTGRFNYDNLDESKDYDIIIHTSPVGMYPNNLQTRINLDIFQDLEALVDLIYNPLKTRFILDGEKRGIKTATGLSMLVAQAYYAGQVFTGYDFPKYLINDILGKLEKEMSNIVLIGMPGSGKTSLGREVARLLNRDFIDTDKEIEKISKSSTEKLILEKGEEAFRDIESQVIEESTKDLGKVIATGGGSILREKNRYCLKQNGLIVYLDRDLDKLDRKKRPLSKDILFLKKLYNERLPIYEAMADIKISPIEDDIGKTAGKIIERISK